MGSTNNFVSYQQKIIHSQTVLMVEPEALQLLVGAQQLQGGCNSLCLEWILLKHITSSMLLKYHETLKGFKSTPEVFMDDAFGKRSTQLSHRHTQDQHKTLRVSKSSQICAHLRFDVRYNSCRSSPARLPSFTGVEREPHSGGALLLVVLVA